MATKTTSNATTDGITIFSGLKLEAACGAGGIVPETETVTGSRRGTAGATYCGGTSRAPTTVTSSGSGGGCSAVAGVTGPIRWIVMPAAIVKSSISSATVW